MTLQDIQRLMQPLAVRVANLVSRALVQTVDDDNASQLLQLEMAGGIGEVRDEIEHVQNYGFTSVPREGAEATVVFVNGKRDHGVAVAVDDPRYRVTGLQAGEVCVYTDQGDRVIIKRGGTIEVTASTKVKVDAPVVELAGNTESAILGDTYRTAEDTYLSAIVVGVQAALSALGLTGASTALANAQLAFIDTAATYKSSKVKLS